MRLISTLALLASAFVLGACSSPAPDPTKYLLRGTAKEGATRIDAPTRIGLGRVVVAPYLLSGRGIVLETAPGEVRAAREHQWAEPLDAGLRWFLRVEIARSLDQRVGGGLADRTDWDYIVDVYISRLHGTMSGKALLEAAYMIRSTGEDRGVWEYRFSRQETLAKEGYPALVASEQRLLAELAAAIGQGLRDAGGSQPE